jgi:ubiquinone/menaquinone biosynthesis C-methylase UbiE
VTTTQSPQQTLAAVYDEGAEAYDRHWAPALHRHAKVLTDRIPAGLSRTVVDVAAGAGTLTPDLRRVAGPMGIVVALDRSRGMLRRAPTDLRRVQADATRLPLAEGSADVVVLAFVLFLLPDARTAVAEAARVLRTGGWLLAATWQTQASLDADVVLREELDAAGAPAFPQLPRSDHLTDSPARMTALLKPAGFGDVDTLSRPLNAVFDSNSLLALKTGGGALGWRFARLDQRARDRVRRRTAERLGALPSACLVDRSQVLLTWARRR